MSVSWNTVVGAYGASEAVAWFCLNCTFRQTNVATTMRFYLRFIFLKRNCYGLKCNRNINGQRWIYVEASQFHGFIFSSEWRVEGCGSEQVSPRAAASHKSEKLCDRFTTKSYLGQPVTHLKSTWKHSCLKRIKNWLKWYINSSTTTLKHSFLPAGSGPRCA